MVALLTFPRFRFEKKWNEKNVVIMDDAMVYDESRFSQEVIYINTIENKNN